MDRPILPVSDHKRDVGRRLQQALKAAKVRNIDAAEIMGTSKQSVSDYIAGRAYPPQYGCYCLHKIHGITLDWLFLGDWSGLPERLASKLKPDLRDIPVDAMAPDHLGHESDASA